MGEKGGAYHCALWGQLILVGAFWRANQHVVPSPSSKISQGGRKELVDALKLISLFFIGASMSLRCLFNVCFHMSTVSPILH